MFEPAVVVVAVFEPVVAATLVVVVEVAVLTFEVFGVVEVVDVVIVVEVTAAVVVVAGAALGAGLQLAINKPAQSDAKRLLMRRYSLSSIDKPQRALTEIQLPK